MRTTILLAYSALLLGAGALIGVDTSGADFTDSSRTSSVATASPDWMSPTVQVGPLPSGIHGVQTVTATATDRSGVADVALEYSRVGTDGWTELVDGCTGPAGPSPLTYSCEWDTALVPDGAYRVRATASDATAERQSSVSAPVATSVDNSLRVDLAPVASPASRQVQLTARVTKSSSASAKVSIELLVGGAWLQVGDCAASNLAALTCSWDTATATDGQRRLRARVEAGNRVVTDEQSVVVDNAVPTVHTFSVPAGVLSGSVQLAATAADSHSSVASVSFELRRQGATTWLPCGVDATAPYTCELDTTGLVDGHYEIRAVATDAAGNRSAAVTVVRQVGNTAAVVSVTSPVQGSKVSGSVPLAATASSTDGGNGVRFQVRPTGAGTFTDVCSAAGAPYSCSWNSAAIGYGGYEVRAVLTLGSGVEVLSAPVTVTVDNVAGSVSITGPAAGLVRGTVGVTAAVASNAPVGSVRIEATSTPSGTFLPLCTDAVAPFECAWDTAATAYGAREVRAVATLANGTTITSVARALTVDNRVLAAADVQAGNGNGTPGAGDAVTFTYSGLVDLSTVRSGFSGATTGVSGLTLQGGGGGVGAVDRLVFPAGVNLGEVRFAQDYVNGGATVVLTGSTISAATVNVGGLPVTRVTVVLGTPSSGTPNTTSTPGAMVWAPPTAVRDLFGTAGTGAAATETGAGDADL